MLSENIFKITLGVSLIAHGVVFWRMPLFRQLSFIPEKKIEVNYYLANKEKDFSVYKDKKSFDKIRPKEDKIIQPKLEKDMINFKLSLSPIEHKINQKLASGQMVNLTNIQNEYRRNPTELNKYYFEIWEKIRHSAYQELYSNRSLSGEVRLVFSVYRNGRLGAIEVVQEKAELLDNLKNAGCASIKDAAPFSSFPKDLNKEGEIFDIIISFEPK